jgi:hypothetical protein
VSFVPGAANGSSWFYYKEIRHDALSHERKKSADRSFYMILKDRSANRDLT